MLIAWSLIGLFIIIDFGQYMKYMKWIAGGFGIMLCLYVLEYKYSVIKSAIQGYWFGTLMLIVHMALFMPEEMNLTAGRSMGLFNNSNSLGSMMLIGIICAIFLIYNTPKSKFWRITYFASIILYLIGLSLSASRKSFLSLGVFLFLFYLLNFLTHKQNRILYVFLFIILIVGMNYLVEYVIEHTYLGSRLSIEEIDKGFSTRVDIYKGAWNILQKDVFLGVGQGNIVVHPEFERLPHSDLMSMVLGSGIIGLLLYLRFYYVILRKFNWVKSRVQDKLTLMNLRFTPILITVYFLIGLGRENYTDVIAMPFIAIFFAYLHRIYIKRRYGY